MKQKFPKNFRFSEMNELTEFLETFRGLFCTICKLIHGRGPDLFTHGTSRADICALKCGGGGDFAYVSRFFLRRGRVQLHDSKPFSRGDLHDLPTRSDDLRLLESHILVCNMIILAEENITNYVEGLLASPLSRPGKYSQ